MKVSNVKLGASIKHALNKTNEYGVDTIENLGQFLLSFIGLMGMVLILVLYPICYPFAKYILLPRAIKRTEKATEEQMNRMYPDRKTR